MDKVSDRILLACALFLLAPGAESAEPEVSWQQLVDTSYEYLYERQDKLDDEFEISKHERWDIDQDTGKLIFSNGGVPAVEAAVLFVGSFSTASNTWLWGWANSSIDGVLSERVKEVRSYGQEHGFEKLSTDKWDADEVDGWEMAAISNYLLQGKGVYRPPINSGVLFLVITDIQKPVEQ